MITQSGAVSPSPKPSIGWLDDTEKMCDVGAGSTRSLAITVTVTSTILWFGLPEGAADYPISFNDFFRRKLTAYSAYGAQGEPEAALLVNAFGPLALGTANLLAPRPRYSALSPAKLGRAGVVMATWQDALARFL